MGIPMDYVEGKKFGLAKSFSGEASIYTSEKHMKIYTLIIVSKMNFTMKTQRNYI